MERSTQAPDLHPHTIMDPPPSNMDSPPYLAVVCKFLIFEILVLFFHPRHLSEESNKQNLHLSVNSTRFQNSDGLPTYSFANSTSYFGLLYLIMAFFCLYVNLNQHYVTSI